MANFADVAGKAQRPVAVQNGLGIRRLVERPLAGPFVLQPAVVTHKRFARLSFAIVQAVAPGLAKRLAGGKIRVDIGRSHDPAMLGAGDHHQGRAGKHVRAAKIIRRVVPARFRGEHVVEERLGFRLGDPARRDEIGVVGEISHDILFPLGKLLLAPYIPWALLERIRLEHLMDRRKRAAIDDPQLIADVVGEELAQLEPRSFHVAAAEDVHGVAVDESRASARSGAPQDVHRGPHHKGAAGRPRLGPRAVRVVPGEVIADQFRPAAVQGVLTLVMPAGTPQYGPATVILIREIHVVKRRPLPRPGRHAQGGRQLRVTP